MLWSEGAREWLRTAQPPGMRLHEPYDWTEIVVKDCVHVKLERDQSFPTSTRKRDRRNQIVDPMLQLPLFSANPQLTDITNIDLVARLNAEGRIAGLSWMARNGGGELWRPIPVDMIAARRLRQSWLRRGVPWLTAPKSFVEVADASRIMVAKDAEIARLQALVGNGSVAGDASTNRTLPTIGIPDRPASWTGRPKPKSQSGFDAE